MTKIPDVWTRFAQATLPRRLSGLSIPFVCFLLMTMLLLLLGSVREEALTSDEPAHITAGYASLRFRDARLNPEHPPLLKMLAAVPLLALQLHFPLTSPAWQEGLNDQWTTAELFLYASGNDPHRIAALARLGPVSLTAVLGLVLFGWTRRWAGDTAALLTLVLYVSSPTVLAHGRLVTTDVAAAFGVALAGFAFVPFLATAGSWAALRAGLALGLALLCKFSTVLLLPWVTALTLLWIILEPRRRGRYLRGLALIAGSAALLVLLPYLWATADYPPDRQRWDTYFTFFHVGGGPAGRTGDASAEADFARLRQDRSRDLRACVSRPPEGGLPRLTRCPIELAIWLADKAVVRAWGQYLAGLLWTMHRVHAGGTADFPFYFLGEVSASGSRAYFPVVYAIKEPLPWHLLSAWALLLALARVWSSAWGVRPLLDWLRGHPAEICMLGWLVLYWGVAIQSNLNIGVRHLLPVFPFAMGLVARELSRWLARPPRPLRPAGRAPLKALAIVCLLLWQGVSVVRVYPSFLAYFNEVVGGPDGGARYVVDSNLDWGQDLRRLGTFVELQRIDAIAVDYFGTSWPQYELGERFIPWRSALGPYSGWLAVSATTLHIAQGRWDPALRQKPEEAYAWLRGQSPTAKIGYSIWVFDLRPSRGALPSPPNPRAP